MSTQTKEQEAPVISKEIIAHDLRNLMTGKAEPAQVEQLVKAVQKTTQAYSAFGNISAMVFYYQFQVGLTGRTKPTFWGEGGGFSLAAGNIGLSGTIYTDDFDKMVRDTRSFGYSFTPVYIAIYFTNEKSELLGHFQSATSGVALGAGGGTGKWTQ